MAELANLDDLYFSDEAKSLLGEQQLDSTEQRLLSLFLTQQSEQLAFWQSKIGTPGHTVEIDILFSKIFDVAAEGEPEAKLAIGKLLVMFKDVTGPANVTARLQKKMLNLLSKNGMSDIQRMFLEEELRKKPEQFRILLDQFLYNPGNQSPSEAPVSESPFH